MEGVQAEATPDIGISMDDIVQCYQAGRVRAAEAACLAVLEAKPDNGDALNLLAVIACDRGEPETALELLAIALAGNAARPALLNTQARALIALRRPEEAEDVYRAAWSADSGLAAVANNLGCLLRDRNRSTEAVAWFRAAGDLLPGSADIARNLAGALADQSLFEASMQAFQHALDLDPSSADSHAACGAMLLAWGRPEAAEAMCREAVRLRPGDGASHNNLGVALRAQGRNDDATVSFATALNHDPACADAHYNLGCLALLVNRLDDARAHHGRALAVAPLHGLALWGACIATLPVLYDSAEQIAVCRAQYETRLAGLEGAAKDPAVSRALAAAAGASQPFFLPYQGRCDRDLQARYGRLMSRLLDRRVVGLAEAPARGERIRLGIVSGYFREHTVWRLILKGWLGQIDRTRFEVTAYHTGGVSDEQTGLARRLCERFVTGPGEAIRSAILASRPHVLLYPEIGMDRVSVRLAAERLAPLQCAGWGHPQTTGLPTMDVFLSSALMEPDEAQDHYTERLVRLPGIGVHYEADERTAEPCSRAELGLRESGVVFWCGQALFKYLPQDDDVFARIAIEVGDCQFVFIGFAEDSAVTDFFEARLRRVFTRFGLEFARYVQILAPMQQPRFLGTIEAADIVLDSIGWSGGRSTLDMLAVAPVIVTLAGTLMRGRHTAGILTAIGVTETIAVTKEEYCAIAIRLARNPAGCAVLRRRMQAGRHRVTADRAPIRAVEEALVAGVAQATAPPDGAWSSEADRLNRSLPSSDEDLGCRIEVSAAVLG